MALPAWLAPLEASWPLTLIVCGAVLLLVPLLSGLELGSWSVPAITVDPPVVAGDEKKTRLSPRKSPHAPKGMIPCYNPGTGEYIGAAPAMTPDQVREAVAAAKAAAAEWRTSSFKQRRLLLRIILKHIVENQEEICRREHHRLADSPCLVIVTCEKIWWLIKEGEQHLRPESRSAGYMASGEELWDALMFYKAARVEYVPVGAVGAIVPWNYPFHNIFNPLTAALFAGNAIVIKARARRAWRLWRGGCGMVALVSEHASWSALYYKRIIDAALAAAGAPADLIVTGYGEAGHALVTSGVGKLIFVMEAAAEKLTPVVLELGGKDAFIVCEDADLDQARWWRGGRGGHCRDGAVLPTALRGAFQSCGQNCAGAERFIVQEGVYDEFVRRAAETTARLRQGPASGEALVDCGAMCMPGQAEKVQELVFDAVKRGAKVLVGGALPRAPAAGGGTYYPPTVLTGVTPDMRIWREEVFGPVMAVVPFATDDEAVTIANDCPFGLGSSVFSGSRSRARRIGERLEAGMTSLNDFATTYMCQSLPFGGVKESGFDRFAGIEGLRGLCVPKAVAEDRWPFKTAIPPLLRYPVSDAAFGFVSSLVWMFYAPGLGGNLKGLLDVISCFLSGGKKKASGAGEDGKDKEQ
eukprot:scaffold7.g3616.t1